MSDDFAPENTLLIDTRFANSMIDEWNEYLILVSHDDGTFELGIAQFEVLGEVNDFTDEDNLELPEEIDGIKVFGSEGDYVLGGFLTLEHTQYSTFKFSFFEKSDVREWLSSEGWSSKIEEILDDIYIGFTKLGGEKKRSSISAFDLEVVEVDRKWVLMLDGKPVKDLSGKNEISHQNKKFIEEVCSEFQSFGEIFVTSNGSIEPIFYGLYAIYSDHLNTDWKMFLKENLSGLLFSDLTFVTNAGPEQIDQHAANSPVRNFLIEVSGENAEMIDKIAHMIYFETYSFMDPEEVVEMVKEEISAGITTQSIDEIVDRVSVRSSAFYNDIYKFLEGLSREQCSALHGLNSMCGNRHFLAALAVISGKISANQFSTCVLSSQNLRHGIHSDVERNDYRGLFNHHLNSVDVSKRFIDLVQDKLTLLISKGEGSFCELKETFSLDVRRSTHDSNYKPIKEAKIETSSLKTIAGFANAKGGILFIGVSDGGHIIGIEREIERFHPSLDKYLLYFKDLVSSRLGKAIFSNLEVSTHKIDGVTILQAKVKPSSSPVFLLPDDEFYVRTAPATEKLSGQDLATYLRQRFQ